MKSGKELIEALCIRLKDEKRLCYDSSIVNLLRSLDKYEVNELITYGTLNKWEREKIKKLEIKEDESKI